VVVCGWNVGVIVALLVTDVFVPDVSLGDVDNAVAEVMVVVPEALILEVRWTAGNVKVVTELITEVDDAETDEVNGLALVVPV
jgi:hypothetical protein